jgi:hypothetical protein
MLGGRWNRIRGSTEDGEAVRQTPRSGGQSSHPDQVQKEKALTLVGPFSFSAWAGIATETRFTTLPFDYLLVFSFKYARRSIF